MTTDTASQPFSRPQRVADVIAAWAANAEPALSISMPVHPAGPEAKQNAIRVKNAVREAEGLLDAHANTEEADALREQLPLLARTDLEHVSPSVEGILWLISPSRQDVIWSPTALDEVVRVSDQAALRPLLPMLNGIGAFHLLALSENRVTLFRGTGTGLQEIPLDEVGSSLEDERWMDDFEKTMQWHSGSRGGDSRLIHGHGGSKDWDEVRRGRFFQVVARAVETWRARREPEVPFGIAAVGTTAAEFAKAYADGPDVEFVLEGSPDDRSDDDLHAAARDALKSRRTRRFEEAEALYQAAIPNDLTCDDAAEIARHASVGKVSHLILAGDDPIPVRREGTHEDGTPQWIALSDDSTNATDLVDVLIAAVLMHGGHVVSAEPDHDAQEGTPPVRAVLRY